MTSIDPAILNALDDLLPLAGFPTLRDDVADRLAPLLVNLAELTAALAERDAARAEVARLRAAVEGLAEDWDQVAERHVARAASPESDHNEALLQVGVAGGRRSSASDLRAALAATEDQP